LYNRKEENNSIELCASPADPPALWIKQESTQSSASVATLS